MNRPPGPLQGRDERGFPFPLAPLYWGLWVWRWSADHRVPNIGARSPTVMCVRAIGRAGRRGEGGERWR